MIYNVVFKEEAVEDIHLAYDWYESKKNGLGENLLIEIDEFKKLLETDPQIFQKRKKDRRYCPLKRFPYIIIYEIEKESIIVFAVFNTFQNPGKLRNRI